MVRALRNLVGLVLLAALLATGWFVWFATRPIAPPTTPYQFVVHPGASVKAVSRQLGREGVFVEGESLWILARATGTTAIQAGTYRIDAGNTPLDLLEKLAHGDVVMTSVLFVEGTTLRQWLEQLAGDPEVRHTLAGKSEAEMRDIFGSAEQMTTVAILDRLHALPESPWDDLKGKSLNHRGLAFRLREYGVKSKNLSIGGEYGPRPKGYTRADLHDAWARYLVPPPPSPDRSATSATAATKPDFQGSAVAAVADVGSAVADNDAEENADKSSTVAAVAAVADVAGSGRDEEVF